MYKCYLCETELEFRSDKIPLDFGWGRECTTTMYCWDCKVTRRIEDTLEYRTHQEEYRSKHNIRI